MILQLYPPRFKNLEISRYLRTDTGDLKYCWLLVYIRKRNPTLLRTGTRTSTVPRDGTMVYTCIYIHCKARLVLLQGPGQAHARSPGRRARSATALNAWGTPCRVSRDHAFHHRRLRARECCRGVRAHKCCGLSSGAQQRHDACGCAYRFWHLPRQCRTRGRAIPVQRGRQRRAVRRWRSDLGLHEQAGERL